MFRSIAIALLMALTISEACRCPMQSIEYYFCQYPVVLKAKIGQQTSVADEARITYDIEIQAVYKNESTVSVPPKVSTADNSASCGAVLQQGTEYLIFVNVDDNQQGYTITSCSFPTEWSEVPQDTQQKLENGQMASSPCPTWDPRG